MLNVTTDLKNAIKQSTVISSGKVDIVNSLETLNFTSSDISKIEVFGTAFNNDKVLGNLAQHSLTLELLGDLTKKISLKNENICKTYIGIDVNGSFEYVQFQDFVITSIIYSDTQNITRIVATDNIVKLNKEFIDSNTYPMTLKSYLESVLDFCDLELENTTFINDDYVVESQPFVNYTSASYILGKVAELALSFVTVNKVSNKIELKKAFDPFTRGYTHQELSAFTHEQLSNYTHFDLMHAIGLDDEQVSKSNYWSFKLSDNWFGTYGVNTLTLGISQVEGENNSVQDDSYVAVDGNIEVIINDNEFINSEDKRLSVINDMFTEVLNYKYSPYTLDYRGFPYLEIGDIVQITNMDNSLFNSPIYEMIIRYDGGLYGQLKAQALSKAETTYLNTNTLSNRVKNAEIKVDKVNGEITLIASEVSDLNGQVSTLTLDVNGLEIIVGDYEDGKLVGTYYNFDGDGFSMTNSSDEVVFYADANGNLTLTGTIVGSTFIAGSDGDRFEFDENSLRAYKDDVKRVEFDYDSIEFFRPDGSAGAKLVANQDNFYVISGTQGSTVFSTLNLTQQSSSINSYDASSNKQYVVSVSESLDLTGMRANNISNNTSSYVSLKATGEISISSLTSSSIQSSINIGDFGIILNSDVDVWLNSDRYIVLSSVNSIGINSQNKISLLSSIGSYDINISGATRTIYRDANGFLKC